MEKERVTHTFEPIYREDSRILILGTFPSVKSREQQFYYGHPRNRFWQVLAELACSKVPQNIEEKKEFLLQNRIALWDVIQSCTIEGSSDSSIRDVVPNNIPMLLNQSQIKEIYANGAKAYSLYEKYVYPSCLKQAVKLPSTSPANAAFSFEKLVWEWGRYITL